MELTGKIAVVTGGASGIGASMCRRFAAEGASGVAVADKDGDGCGAVAADVASEGARALAITADVATERAVAALVERVTDELGPIDLFCANAGIAVSGGVEVTDEEWQRIWSVNVMAHVYAARAVLPRMVARGGGYFLATASAAGLLTNLGSAPYSVTKHAAVALAEWLSITYADEGITVSCLCPQGVRTPMLLGGLAAGDPAGSSVLASGPMLEPEDVAEAVVQGLRDERFLILPHADVATYMRHRAEDPERWLRGMRRLWAQVRQA